MSKFHRAAPPALLLAASVATATLAWAQAPATQQPPPGAQQPPPGARQFRWPDHMRNRQVLPRDINSEQLRETMRGFAISLGVRCSFCHVGTEQMDLSERDFPSDGNPRKTVARRMIRMVARLNRDIPRYVGRDARVTCYTCHRGASTPATIFPM